MDVIIRISCHSPPNAKYLCVVNFNSGAPASLMPCLDIHGLQLQEPILRPFAAGNPRHIASIHGLRAVTGYSSTSVHHPQPLNPSVEGMIQYRT